MSRNRDPVFGLNLDPVDWAEVFGVPILDEQIKQLDLAMISGLHQAFCRPKYTTIFDRKDEWDICCVLDACRFDTFEEVNTLEGDLEMIISAGFNTGVWLERTFIEPHPDLIVIATNAWYTKILGNEYLGQLYRYEPMWKSHWDQLNTVLPDDVTDCAINLHKWYPNKKLVVHYMQPHTPFIANPDLSLKSERVRWEEDFMQTPTATFREMYELYKDNLCLVLKSIERLIEQTEGRLVITSDHGEGFGEGGVAWSHKGGWVTWLLQVPWFKLERYDMSLL